MMIVQALKKWGLLFILIGLYCFFYFDLYKYLTFSELKANREWLLNWRNENYILVLIFFMFLYTISVTASIPGAAFLTITSGFLFGPMIGTIAVVISATIGAFMVFLAVELAFRETFQKKAFNWLQKMEDGFRNNAFFYLLFLRLIPLFPFWALNIVPALLGMDKSKYIIATFIGIIPGSFVYVMVGNGFGHVIDSNQTPRIDIIYDYKILLPILFLALLSITPVIYKKFFKKSD